MSLINIQYYKSIDVVSITSKRGYESRVANSIYLFTMAFNQIREKISKDFSIYIDTDDFTNENSPILAYSNEGKNNVTLIPDHVFLNWVETGINSYDLSCQNIKKRGDEPFVYDKLFWIGNVQTHPIREKLINLYGDNEHFEFYPMNWSKTGLAGEKLTPNKYVSLEDHTKYKYLLDVRGRGYSGRVKLLLFSQRPLFYVERTCEEFYSSDLKPFVHYIPIKEDLSDLVEKYEWAENNYDKAKEIAKNALDYAENNLTTQMAVRKYGQILYDFINKNDN